MLRVRYLSLLQDLSDSIFRGLMALQESREKCCNDRGSYSIEFLQTSLDGVTWIANRFNQKISQVDIDAVSPFPPHSLYMAALQQDRIWKETGDLRCFDASNSLALMLGQFGRRWLNASMINPTNTKDAAKKMVGKFQEFFEEQRSKAEQIRLVL